MIGIICQARTRSNRFPSKIYEDLNGKYTLQRVLEGATKSVVAHKNILAMPGYDEKEFNERYNRGEFNGIVDDRFETYFGDPENLIDRYYNAARKYGIDLIVRITADNPLISATAIDEMLLEYKRNNYNGFMGNNLLVSSLPQSCGTDVEIFPFWMLCEAKLYATTDYQKEHCVPFMYDKARPYNIYGFENRRPNTMISTRVKDFSFDTEEDRQLLLKLTKIYDETGDLNKALETVELGTEQLMGRNIR